MNIPCPYHIISAQSICSWIDTYLLIYAERMQLNSHNYYDTISSYSNATINVSSGHAGCKFVVYCLLPVL